MDKLAMALLLLRAIEKLTAQSRELLEGDPTPEQLRAKLAAIEARGNDLAALAAAASSSLTPT